MANDAPKHEHVVHEKRDGETYFAIGLYVFAIGLPVVFGTYYSLSSPHAAVVNFIAGMTLVIGGAGCMYYGRVLTKRHPDKKQ